MTSSIDNGVYFPESSRELEELRAAFTRSLAYMKQDVEESKWTCDLCTVLFILVLVGLCWRLTTVYYSCLGFSESGDPSCTIMQVWAKIEVRVTIMTNVTCSLASFIADTSQCKNCIYTI